MPTLEELVTLLTQEKQQGRYIDATVFGKVFWFYWSASPHVYIHDEYAWGTDFYNGFDHDDVKTNSCGVRVVRSSEIPP